MKFIWKLLSGAKEAVPAQAAQPAVPANWWRVILISMMMVALVSGGCWLKWGSKIGVMAQNATPSISTTPPPQASTNEEPKAPAPITKAEGVSTNSPVATDGSVTSILANDSAVVSVGGTVNTGPVTYTTVPSNGMAHGQYLSETITMKAGQVIVKTVPLLRRIVADVPNSVKIEWQDSSEVWHPRREGEKALPRAIRFTASEPVQFEIAFKAI